MWLKIILLQFLIINFVSPRPHDISELPPNAPLLTHITRSIGASIKNSAFCTSNGINLSNESNCKYKIIDLQSCDNSSEIVTTKLPKIISDEQSCFMILIRSNTTDIDFETKLIETLENEVYGPLILVFFNQADITEHSYIIDKRMNDELKSKAMNDLKTFGFKLFKGDDDFVLNIQHHLKQLMVNNCSLCLRLSQIFEIFLKINETDINDYEFNTDCFKALLDLPNKFNFNQSYKNSYELFHKNVVQIITQEYYKGETLAELESLDQASSLNFKIRVNFDGFTGIALKSRAFEALEFLIHADFSFPRDFKIKFKNSIVNNQQERLKNYIKEIEDFHKSIVKGDLANVKKFLTNNPHLTYARNLDNKSALKAAFDSNQLNIYAYLRSHGMNFAGIKEYFEFFQARNRLSKNKKEQIRQFNMKFLSPASKLNTISKMIQKSSFVKSHHIAQESTIQAVIKQVFEDIYSIHPELLEIASASNELRLIFDFLSFSLNDFDPSMENSLGIVDDEYDLVMVAAASLLSPESRFHDRKTVLGTLSHELMHYVMSQMYENELNPYAKKDFERKKIFHEIFKKYENLTDNNYIIEAVYNRYDDKLKHCELIARTVQLLTAYHNKPELEEVKEKYKDIIDFYNQHVLADMREFIPTMHTREKVRELNSWLDLVAEIESYDVENTKEEETETDDDDNAEEEDENKIDGKKDSKSEEELEEEVELPEITEIQEYLDEDSQQRLKVITTENPKLILQKLYYKLRKSKTITIYVASSFSKAKNFDSVFNKIDNVQESVPLIIYCDQVKKLKKFVKMLEKTTFRKVVAIADKNEFDRNAEKVQKWIKKIEL